ncbi:MAG: hypothetical protein GY703_14150 [Gammaproteobacteria bacterium]|nr:hypothetical protein [Gammaproteobacteria bacterium]
MTNPNEPTLLVLYTGLFPDADTVLEALRTIDGFQIEQEELADPEMSPAGWDRVLKKIFDAQKVITV